MCNRWKSESAVAENLELQEKCASGISAGKERQDVIIEKGKSGLTQETSPQPSIPAEPRSSHRSPPHAFSSLPPRVPAPLPTGPCHLTLAQGLRQHGPVRMNVLPSRDSSFPRPLWARVGDDHLLLLQGEQLRLTTQAFIHPKYQQGSGPILPRRTDEHDIMLLKLRRPAVMGHRAQTLRLPYTCARPRDTCQVAGWGTTTTRRGKTGALDPGSEGGSPGPGMVLHPDSWVPEDGAGPRGDLAFSSISEVQQESEVFQGYSSEPRGV